MCSDWAYAAWYRFFEGLHRDPPEDKDWSSPAIAYTHTPSSTRYVMRYPCVGKGQYGCVHAYDAETPPSMDLPCTFCVKFITHDAHAEVAAVDALSALVATNPAARGFVPATVLRHADDVAEVAMPLFAGTLCKTMRSSTPVFAVAVVLRLATTIDHLWSAGLAYTDIKSSKHPVRLHQARGLRGGAGRPGEHRPAARARRHPADGDIHLPAPAVGAR